MLKIEVYWREYCGKLVSYAATIATCKFSRYCETTMSNHEYFVRIENKNVSKFVNFFITEEFHEQNWIEKLL